MANEYEYFPLYVRLLLLDTQDMSNEEFGAYCRLFMQAWDQTPVGYIPSDDKALTRLARCRDDAEWARVKTNVLSRFKSSKSGRMYQKRLVETYRALKEGMRAKREHGMAGAKARWGKEKDAGALPEHSPPNGKLNSKKKKTIPVASATGSGDAATGDLKTSRQARALGEIWKPRWAAAHQGEAYPEGKVDFVKVADILARLGKSARDETHLFERFAKITDAALSKPEEYGWEGHKLTKVCSALPELVSEVSKREKGIHNANGHRKHNANSGTLVEELTL